jgi:hypothetical protein
VPPPHGDAPLFFKKMFRIQNADESDFEGQWRKAMLVITMSYDGSGDERPFMKYWQSIPSYSDEDFDEQQPPKRARAPSPVQQPQEEEEGEEDDPASWDFLEEMNEEDLVAPPPPAAVQPLAVVPQPQAGFLIPLSPRIYQRQVAAAISGRPHIFEIVRDYDTLTLRMGMPEGQWRVMFTEDRYAYRVFTDPRNSRQQLALFFNLPYTYNIRTRGERRGQQMIQPDDRRYRLGIVIVLLRLVVTFGDVMQYGLEFIQETRDEAQNDQEFEDRALALFDSQFVARNVPAGGADRGQIDVQVTESTEFSQGFGIDLRVYVMQTSKEAFVSVIQDISANQLGYQQ